MKVPLEKDEEMATRRPPLNLLQKGDSAVAEKTAQHTPQHQAPHQQSMHSRPTQDDVELFAASTNMIGDATTLLGMTPTANSLANAINANGPILDINGNIGLVVNHFKEASKLTSQISTVTDNGDPDKAKLVGVSSALNGGGAPSGTLITDMTTVVSTAPTAASNALANNPNGPIMDSTGCANSVNIMLKEAKNILTLVNRVLDGADPMKTLVGNLLTALV